MPRASRLILMQATPISGVFGRSMKTAAHQKLSLSRTMTRYALLVQCMLHRCRNHAQAQLPCLYGLCKPRPRLFHSTEMHSTSAAAPHGLICG